MPHMTSCVRTWVTTVEPGGKNRTRVLARVLLCGLDAAQAGACRSIARLKLQDEVVLVAGQTIVAASGSGVGLAHQLGNVTSAEAVHGCSAGKRRGLHRLLRHWFNGRLAGSVDGH